MENLDGELEKQWELVSQQFAGKTEQDLIVEKAWKLEEVAEQEWKANVLSQYQATTESAHSAPVANVSEAWRREEEAETAWESRVLHSDTKPSPLIKEAQPNVVYEAWRREEEAEKLWESNVLSPPNKSFELEVNNNKSVKPPSATTPVDSLPVHVSISEPQVSIPPPRERTSYVSLPAKELLARERNKQVDLALHFKARMQEAMKRKQLDHVKREEELDVQRKEIAGRIAQQDRARRAREQSKKTLASLIF